MLIMLLRASWALAMPPDVRRYLQLASLIFGTMARVFALVLRCMVMMLFCLLPLHGAASIQHSVLSPRQRFAAN